MQVTIQRIPNRFQSKTTAFAASWEVFDECDYLIGYVDDIGEDSSTLTVSPVPSTMGYSDTDLKILLAGLQLAKSERKAELAKGSTNAATDNHHRLTDTTDTVVLERVPELLQGR